MNYFDPYPCFPNQTTISAWDSGRATLARTPRLTAVFEKSGGVLFPRFAACYAELRALPRSARRALQRRIARSSELAAILPEYLQQRGRRLQHRMAWSLAGAALLLALGQGVATAATITVTTSNPNIIADGQCSLIEAIMNANNDAATHADVTLSAAYASFYGQPIGLPLIASRITIEGNGAMIAREGNAPAFGLMAVMFSGDLTLRNLALSGGFSSFGGGVFNGGTLSIQNSTISGNTADFAGGVENFFGNLTIENSTVSGNTANGGGGVFNYAGFLTLTNSTISGNSANEAGGLFNTGYCCGYFGGYAGELTLNNSLIAGNQAAVAPEIENSNYLGNVNANNFNLFGANGDAGVTGFTPGPTDIVPAPGVAVADILGPLTDNGGPTETHALVAGSPAIDTGDPGGCRDTFGTRLLTDQRGFARHVDGNNDGTGRCDIGAFESGAEFVPVPTPTLTVSKAGTGTGTVTSNPAGINCGGDCSENYDADTVVTLTATAAPDSFFAGFSGDADCADGAVTMNADKSCTATFSMRLNLTAANGGEIWRRGSKQLIQWTSNGINGNVKIELSRDGGSTWKTLFKRAADDGSQPWRVNKPATTQARIRICSLSSPSICDTSDANFTIQ